MSINLGRQLQRIKRDKITLMQTIGVNGTNHFKHDNFEAQGFIDKGVTKWKPKKKKDGRKTLVGKTGILRNTISYIAKGSVIEFFSKALYAKVHNEGLKAGRGSGFKMPKRQFIGNSAVLNQKNKKAILRFLKRIMK